MRVIDLATLVLALLAALVDLLGPAWANWISRPLVNLLLLLVAAAGTRGAYRTLILAGLVCATIGDLLPLISGGLFFASLVVFLAVHFCYIGAFWTGVGLRGAWIARLVYVTLGVAMVAALWPVLLPLHRVAVAVYAAFIVIMAGQAAGRWAVRRTPGAQSAAMGAGLFLISDGVLALDRWRADFYGAGFVVLLTYYVAQWLIARSTSDVPAERDS